MADQRTIGERGHIEEGSVDSSRCQGSGHALHRLAVVAKAGPHARTNLARPEYAWCIRLTYRSYRATYLSVREALRNAPRFASFVPRLMKTASGTNRASFQIFAAEVSTVISVLLVTSEIVKSSSGSLPKSSSSPPPETACTWQLDLVSLQATCA